VDLDKLDAENLNSILRVLDGEKSPPPQEDDRYCIVKNEPPKPKNIQELYDAMIPYANSLGVSKRKMCSHYKDNDFVVELKIVRIS